MAILVRKPGLFTTVQDEGRDGFYALGFPPSGAMDKFSYRVGNMLVNNRPGSASMEATYIAPELEFRAPTVVAVTGGEIRCVLNGEPIRTWASFSVQAGDLLCFETLKSGARVYISVAGGVDVEPVLDSRSTYTLTGIGGFKGRTLEAGDLLPIGSSSVATPGRRVSDQMIPNFGQETVLRVIVSLCSYRFTETALETFLETAWTITPDANRTAYRYKGPPLELIERDQPFGAGNDQSNVVDMPYPLGSIQVPGGIEPILLLADAVTAGGYATLGTVIGADLPVAGQTRTGGRVRFEAVSLDEALRARSQAQTFLMKIQRDIEVG
ncbi:MAG: biotin-dependent carboxyltransferase [Thermoleophilia bacterium]|nr:biotin-dependent carboxyltransferase [Thermoleophilia bacterium]